MSETFEAETAEVNRKRIRFLGPLMVVVHAAHAAFFASFGAERGGLGPEVLLWHDGLALAHATMIPVTVVGSWIAWRSTRPVLLRWLGPVVATLQILHGALCTSLDQLVVSNMTAYLGYCLGIPVIYCLSPRATVVAYALGAVAMGCGLLLLQDDPEVLTANLPPFLTVTLVGAALSMLIHAARRREFGQRRTIAAQGAELARLNGLLEQRVSEQVAEILEKAQRLDALNRELQEANARLQAQVRERSAELSLALSRLAGGQEREEALRPGMQLGERFFVEELIGAGGMGAVYAGRDRTTGGRVAIKIIQTSATHQLDALRRFIREAGAAATVDHPAVVRMIHVDVSPEGLVFQVQELVEGETLSQRMGRPWSPGEAARLGAVLSDALSAAHQRGIVHLDVKPGNIMLTTRSPGLKLLDFGIAKLYDVVSTGAPVTRSGGVFGTPEYMAPEQATGRTHVTDRSDVYAVGVVLFRLLTGSVPFDGGSARATLNLHRFEVPLDVRAYVASIPEALALLVARCLAKEPSERPDAATLAEALSGFADASGAPALEAVPRQVLDATLDFMTRETD